MGSAERSTSCPRDVLEHSLDPPRLEGAARVGTSRVGSRTELVDRRVFGVPLFWRLAAYNALVLAGAFVWLVAYPPHGRAPLAAAGLGVALAAQVLLVGRAVAPLRRMAGLMRTVDPLEPGRRVGVTGGASEIRQVAGAFNGALDRLETERRESGRRMLAAQEDERRAVARELHDAVGQDLTGVLLQLERTSQRAPSDLRVELRAAQETARAGLVDLHRLVRGLRPEALDDLGLPSALASLAERVSTETGVSVAHELDRTLPGLAPETELVLYRVAQEGLTNAVRHAKPSAVKLKLERRGDEITLRVLDDGQGVLDREIPGDGIRGMRERALLIGAHLSFHRCDPRGHEVRLEVDRVAA